jgi:hypothetical protein
MSIMLGRARMFRNGQFVYRVLAISFLPIAYALWLIIGVRRRESSVSAHAGRIPMDRCRARRCRIVAQMGEISSQPITTVQKPCKTVQTPPQRIRFRQTAVCHVKGLSYLRFLDMVAACCSGSPISPPSPYSTSIQTLLLCLLIRPWPPSHSRHWRKRQPLRKSGSATTSQSRASGVTGTAPCVLTPGAAAHARPCGAGVADFTAGGTRPVRFRKRHRKVACANAEATARGQTVRARAMWSRMTRYARQRCFSMCECAGCREAQHAVIKCGIVGRQYPSYPSRRGMCVRCFHRLLDCSFCSSALLPPHRAPTRFFHPFSCKNSSCCHCRPLPVPPTLLLLLLLNRCRGQDPSPTLTRSQPLTAST